MVKLVNLLSNRFHCTYSRTDARELTISAFAADVGDTELESLMDSYMTAWNILVSQGIIPTCSRYLTLSFSLSNR